MATPAISLLREAVPTIQISILALRQGVATMARASGWFTHVYAWDPDKDGLQKGIKLILKIRKEHYGQALMLYPTEDLRFWAFTRLAGISSIYKAIKKNTDQHDVDVNLDSVRRWLKEVKCIDAKQEAFYPLCYPQGLLNSIEEQPYPKMNQQYYVLHPGSSAERGMTEKRWAPQKYGELVAYIYRKHGLSCALIGGPEEGNLKKQVMESAKGFCEGNIVKVFLPQPSSLVQTSQAIANSKFFLGNDSGLMHVAVALGKPCMAIFGPTNEKETGPYILGRSQNDPPKHCVIRKVGTYTYSISKNGRKVYDGGGGIGELGVDDVWTLASEWIAKNIQ